MGGGRILVPYTVLRIELADLSRSASGIVPERWPHPASSPQREREPQRACSGVPWESRISPREAQHHQSALQKRHRVSHPVPGQVWGDCPPSRAYLTGSRPRYLSVIHHHLSPHALITLGTTQPRSRWLPWAPGPINYQDEQIHQIPGLLTPVHYE